MSVNIRKYDDVTGRELLGPIRPDEVVDPCGPRPSPVSSAARMMQARQILDNRLQNYGRASMFKSGTLTPPLPVNQLFYPDFDVFESIPGSDFRHWEFARDEYGIGGWSFVCNEAGVHNIKGGILVVMSLPAALAVKATKAEAEILYTNANRDFYTLLWQASEIAPFRVLVGPPQAAEQLFLVGWSLTFADKFFLECGDRIWLRTIFNGFANVAAVERYEARLAIQKTGDPMILSGECNV
jgi:hypothetical protein